MTQNKATEEPNWLAHAGIDPPTIQQCVEKRRGELQKLLFLIEETILRNDNVLLKNPKKPKQVLNRKEQNATANISALEAMKLEVSEEMEEQALTRYCDGLSEGRFDFGAFVHLAYEEVIDRAPPGDINQDMRWLAHGTMWSNEWIDIVAGRRPISDLEEWLPDALEEVESKEVRSILNVLPNVGTDVLESALTEVNNGSYLVANILLLPFIESFVREGCRVVRKHQHFDRSLAEVDAEINERHTLAKLVDWSWVEDIDINMLDLVVSYRSTSTQSVQDALGRARRAQKAYRKIRKMLEGLLSRSQDVTNRQEEWESIRQDIQDNIKRMQALGADLIEDPKTITVKLGLNSLLNFLVRRHTDDRNQLLHGHFAEFREAWKTYTYLRAIVQTCSVFELYREQHGLFKIPD